MKNNIGIKLLIFLIVCIPFSIINANDLYRNIDKNDIDFINSKNHISFSNINKNYGTGLKNLQKDHILKNINQHKISINNLIDFSELPINHDNSLLKYFPPIGNQGKSNSCVAWTAGYYVKTFQEAKEHNWDLSNCEYIGDNSGYPSPVYQDKIFSPGFIYNQINEGIDDGATFTDALTLINNIGACSWKEMIYNQDDCISWPSENAWREAPLYRSNSSIIYTYDTSDVQISELKSFLVDSNICIIGINANHYSLLSENDIFTTDNYTGTGINHANVIVGYDDSLKYEENGIEKSGAFKVANCWGIGNWENVDDGFLWISYECMKKNIQYSMYFEDLIDYSPTLIAEFKPAHPQRELFNISLGIGDPGNPKTTKYFADYYYKGGREPFPDNKIIIDITEFENSVDYSQDSMWLNIYNNANYSGELEGFKIRKYSDYAQNEIIETYYSKDSSTIISPYENYYNVVHLDNQKNIGLVINNIVAAPGSDINIPVTVKGDIQDAALVELHLNFDNGYLEYNGIESNYFTEGDIQDNDDRLDIIWLFDGSYLDISNGDTLFVLNMEISKQAQINDIYSVSFVDTNIIADIDENVTDLYLRNGIITIQSGYSISGNLSYYNGINLVADSIMLSGNSKEISITNENGNYNFENINGNIQIEPLIKTPESFIDGSDLLRHKNYLLGITELSKYSEIAADCNGDNSINSIDLLRLKKYLLGMETDMPVGSWQYYPGRYEYDSLESNRDNQDFIAYVNGDVNAEYTLTGKMASHSDSTYDQEIYFGSDYSIKDEFIHIPIKTLNRLNVAMIDWSINCDTTMFQFVDIESDFIKQSDVNLNQDNIEIVWIYNGVEQTIDNNICTLIFNLKNNPSSGLIQFSDHNLISGKDEKCYSVSYSNFQISPTAIDDIGDEKFPNETQLFDNYPNPFNPTTTISYYLKNTSKVQINIYDINGRLIDHIDKNQQAGCYQIQWHVKNTGIDLPTGIYFYQLRYNGQSIIKKMVLIK